MVKSYNRFEPSAVFGVVSSNSTVLNIPGGSAGRAIVGAAGSVLVWDIKTGEQVTRLFDENQAPKAQAVCLSHEPTSNILAVGYSDGTIRVWDLTSGTNLITFNGHKTSVSALKFDSSGTRLISGSFDTHIVVWDLVEEAGVFRLRGHKAHITALILINDSWLISTSKDGIIKLWDLETQFAVESHMAHKNECWGATLQDSQLVTGSNGTELKLWNVDLTKPEGSRITAFGVLEKQSKHRPVSLHIYGDYLLCSSSDSIQVWKQRTQDELKKVLKRKEKRALKKKTDEEEAVSIELVPSDIFIQHALIRTKAKIYSVAVAKNSQLVVNLANNSIETWSTNGEEPERVHVIDLSGHRTDIRDISLSSDNKLLATGSNGLIKLYNVRSKNVLRTIENTGYVLCIRFLPGDALVVAGTKEGVLNLYDMTTSSLVDSFPAHEGSVWSLDVSADGKSIVSGGADKTVKFWDLRVVQKEVDGQPDVTVPTVTLKNTHKLEFTEEVLAVKLSPSGKLVAASLLDNTIKVYYRDTLKFFLNLYGHQLPVLSLDISHDSKMLISSSADKNIKIWGLDFGDVHKSIFGHDDSILKVVFEPESHNFFSCSKDGFVKYWDGDKFQQIQRLQGHHSEVWSLAIANDASFIVSSSHDKSIRVWEQTDEPVFLEEERENELEEAYEENLVESLERDQEQENNKDQEDTSEAVSRHTIDSLKAGERLFEALQISTEDLENKPNPRNIILSTLNVSAERYLMDVLSKIKSNLVEDALLTFPLDSINALFKFIAIWIRNKWNITLVCRVLFFCLRTYHKQIVANKLLQVALEDIKTELRDELNDLSDVVGFNIAHLKFVKDQWDMDHISSFEDASQQATTKKREFPTVGV